MPITFYNHAYGPVSKEKTLHRRIWPYFDLFWVHSGKMTMLFEPGRCVLEGGQGVLIYPHTPFHSGEIERTCRASVQHFSIKAGNDLLNLFRSMMRLRHGFEHLIAPEPEAVDVMIASAIRMAGLPAHEVMHDLRVAQLAMLLGELKLGRQRGAGSHDRLRSFMKELEFDPVSSLSLAEMADRAGFSESHFRALFKAYQGEAPLRHRQYLRMREAARLLRETDRPIKQVSAQLGFTQVSHFYRAFKDAHGTTPAQYRADHATWA